MVDGIDRAAEKARWLAYFYPDTVEEGIGTLRNKFDVRDARLLDVVERAAVNYRARQIETGQVTIPHTFDLQHLRGIHGHLFRDVYEWAGETRDVEMRKMREDSPQLEAQPTLRKFASPQSGEIQELTENVRDFITGFDLPTASRLALAKIGAGVYSYLNQAHPFREGNGRTSQQLLRDLASHTRFTFDFSRVSKSAWNEASVLSAPRQGHGIDPRPFVAVFEQLTVDPQRANHDGGALRLQRELHDPTRAHGLQGRVDRSPDMS